MKRRLEDLERRAGSDSASPERTFADPVQSKPEAPEPSPRQSSSSKAGRKSWSHAPNGIGHEKYSATEEKNSMFSQQSTRQLSASPPMFSYPSYPYTTSYTQSMYAQQSPYQSIPSQYGEYLGQSSYLEPLPASMSLVNPTKQASSYADEDILNPFSMSYASMAGIDISASASQSDSHLQVRIASSSVLPTISSLSFLGSSCRCLWMIVLILTAFRKRLTSDSHRPRHLPRPTSMITPLQPRQLAP